MQHASLEVQESNDGPYLDLKCIENHRNIVNIVDVVTVANLATNSDSAPNSVCCMIFFKFILDFNTLYRVPVRNLSVLDTCVEIIESEIIMRVEFIFLELKLFLK